QRWYVICYPAKQVAVCEWISDLWPLAESFHLLTRDSSSAKCARSGEPVMAQPGGRCMLSKRVILVVVALCCLFGLVPNALFSQETTAGVQGYVKDPTGAVVAGATVEVSGPTLLGSRKTETDTTGFYR